MVFDGEGEEGIGRTSEMGRRVQLLIQLKRVQNLITDGNGVDHAGTCLSSTLKHSILFGSNDDRMQHSPHLRVETEVEP